MKIGMSNDHAAIELKLELKEYLESKGHEVVDYGCGPGEKADYPVSGRKTAEAVVSGEVERGIVLCGSGVGISISANKVKGIRCCLCSEPYSAKLSRQHNNSNMLAMGARVVGPELAKMIVDHWMEAEFEAGRHGDRVNMIIDYESSC